MLSNASSVFLWWTVVQLVGGCWVLVRIVRAAHRRMPLSTIAGAMPTIPTISVVIPARNEALRITACLQAVVGAPGVLEVIVVDDQSSDATARVAQQLGATVVRGAPLPSGWVGKAWALHQGVMAATGEWVVTLDADAVAHPQLMQGLVHRAQRDGIRFATVGGRFECPSAGSRWLHPAMLTTLVYRYGPAGFAGKVRANQQLANGQCMALSRRDAIEHDVFVKVCGETIEDVALVRRLATMGWSVALLDGSDMLTVRMFESFADTWNGWGRSLSLASVDPLPRIVGHCLVLAVVQVAPLWMLVGGVSTPVSLTLVAVRIGTLFGTRRAYVHRGVWYWLSPFADIAAVLALSRGVFNRLVGRDATWRGRTYSQ